MFCIHAILNGDICHHFGFLSFSLRLSLCAHSRKHKPQAEMSKWIVQIPANERRSWDNGTNCERLHLRRSADNVAIGDAKMQSYSEYGTAAMEHIEHALHFCWRWIFIHFPRIAGDGPETFSSDARFLSRIQFVIAATNNSSKSLGAFKLHHKHCMRRKKNVRDANTAKSSNESRNNSE